MNKQQDPSKDAASIKELIQDMLDSSKSYFSMDALPERDKLVSYLKEHDGVSMDSFSSIEKFFIVECSDDMLKKIRKHELAEAYCSSLIHLPGDWWGRPGNIDSEIGMRMLDIPNSQLEAQLVKLLDDSTPLDYRDGELRAMSKELEWTVSDLASGFLSEILHVEFDHRATSEKRDEHKSMLRKLVESK